MRPRSLLLAMALIASVRGGASAGDGKTAEEGWIELSGSPAFEAFRGPTGDWAVVGAVHLDPNDPKRLAAEPGTGIIYNGPKGRTTNLITREKYGDLELHLEFLIPKGSNSGVKFQGVYEIQIFDSFGKKDKDLKGSDCGGIYPRAELLPTYHHLDDGIAPKSNACRPPGEWQTLDITFRVPRFDSEGKKVANARFEKVVLNGRLIQDDVEAPTPTGNNWRNKPVPTGPFLIQADHGPIALRNVRIRPLPARSPG